MANLYFLMASLPTLSVNDDAPRMPYPEFLKQAHGGLGEQEYRRLLSFDLQNIPTDLKGLGNVEKKFWHWEIAVRNELVKLRAKAFNMKEEEFLHTGVDIDSADIRQTALNAFEESDPLKVEIELNKARWALLESERTLEYFSMESLLIYSMQLQLITRRSLFTKELGEANYQKEYELILGEAKTVLMENIR
ncbi:DUF2764 family protein [Entomospira culicis]|uniref:DUF2764 family protein n=1 Tax=Entomospira culicis TaxID=2719989 RepID=A0A968GFK2_9SPIO|nr:DUF2764 family protein [Entomospira culicis]NIZ19471.1 DUF2764 family protein [Entomospira culicis]NIZ69624.1 DUF2764 family protein [Entomospira culicis]WDI36735.1 DUF2764 family protein [Entomospira culicis]WDI38364.1 DUF2764 family protein [Entomospira culicis]